MSRLRSLIFIVGVSIALLWGTFLDSQTPSLPSTGLMGRVTSSEGKPLEGVPVSAKARDKTYTTTVFTDKAGTYYFPRLANGEYRMWAQAVGFEITYAERIVSSGKKITQNFELKAYKDFYKQLSDAEWFNSLPDDTAEDRRMKNVLLNNCGTCHESAFALEKRFDAEGWGIIVDYAIREIHQRFSRVDTPRGKPKLDEKGQPVGISEQYAKFYKDDIVAYLSRVRGPKPFPLKWKPFPRPTGDATAIVVTEYDLTRGEEPGYYGHNEYRNGSDWAHGIRAQDEEWILHDAMVSTYDDNIYFGDSRTPSRTLGRLDIKTGRITSYASPDEDGIAAGIHGGTEDDKTGDIWLGSELLIKFDPRTQEFTRYPSSARGLGAAVGVGVDSKGYVWTASPDSAIRLDPKTGKYMEIKAPTKNGRPYDIAVDSKDNVWIAMIGADRIGFVDGRNFEFSEMAVPPLDEHISPKDREIGERLGGGWTTNAPLYQQGPRRMGADPNGNFVWVGEYWTSRLLKIDINTHEMTEYKLPPEYRYAYLYDIAVDKNHMVWIGFANADQITKFNPFTEKFTMYQLPTRGTNPRHIWVDNSTDPPTVIVPYTGANKIARIQFRTNTAR